ncbi:tetratricopeptide repeat protein [Streptomyces tailanensis]|uniref:tetratricopeptide repeat protein n=1 Tax=Streptomyces tailanensis TaxID=2569858 RepID=UPI00122E57A1|nr:tetratricopeptide repeat protein [Streptomyces tailanensis]
MSPSASFGDRFSASGRLRRLWSAAAQEPDPQSGLGRLRDVLGRMERRPDAAAPLWGEFLRSLTGQPFRPLLTDADFEALERVGGLVAETGEVGLDQALRPLAGARFGRGEGRQGVELLTRLYWAESVQDQARVALADELARSGERDAARLDVYADLLRRGVPRPPAVVALVADVLRVDFSSEPERLRQAAALAGAGVPGADRAAGLHRLLVAGEPDAAREHFLAACQADPRDETALLGLLVAHVRAGRAASIPGWALDAADRAAPRVAAAAALGRILAWLGSDTDAPPPAADRLVAVDLTHEAGPWPAYALGRLHLLDGDAARARDLLVPLASGDVPLASGGSVLPRWRYHAAWAQLLTGDRAGLRLLGDTMTRRPDDWAFACLLLDSEPDAGPGSNAAHVASGSPPGYQPVARIRSDLAGGRRPPGPPPAPPDPPPDDGDLPERLEALRTALAEAYGRADGAADMAELLRNPLYRRLPRADRLLWSGLRALREEPEEGRRLLGSALALGHQRAALVLAAHHLQERRPGRAHRLLAGLTGAKAELLRVWAEAAGGGADAGIEAGLEKLVRHRLPQVPYVLGVVRLHQMAGEGSTLDPEDAPYHARRAARELAGAVAAGPDAVPPDAAVLLRAARTVTHGTAPPPGADEQAGLPPAVRQHPWAEWVLGLALLVEDPEAAGLGLCGRLAALVEETDEPPPQAVTVLATALTRAGMLSEDLGRRNALAQLVCDLADRHDLPGVHALADRLVAAAMVRPAPGRPPVRAERLSGAVQPVLALASAAGDLSRGDRDAALRQLRAAPGDDGVCALLADVLDGRSPESAPPDGGGERAALLRVVHAAGLVESDVTRSLELLSAAAGDCDLSTVTDVNRLLPALLASDGRPRGKPGGKGRNGGKGKGRSDGVKRRPPGQPHPLADLVKRLIDDSAPGLTPAVLAGCATAIGEYELAEQQWKRAHDANGEGDGNDSVHVCTQYGRLLCHRAVTVRRAEDPLRGAELLRRAADLQPAEGPALNPLPSPRRAKSLAHGLEYDFYVDRLLNELFPGALPEPVPWERPGRYTAALEKAIEADGKLTRALRSGGRKGVQRAWEERVKTLRYGVRLHHTLAVLYREVALGGPAPASSTGGGHLARATVLWTLLLGSADFWEQHGETPAGPDAERRLRIEVCAELFALHRKLGAEALQSGQSEQRETALLHLRVLDAVREGESAVHGLLREFDFPWSPAVDPERWAGISALAGSVIDEWCAEVVRTAEKALGDPAAIAELDEGIDKDYESGVRQLEPLIDLGVPLPRLLQTGLQWYNDLQNCHYRMSRTGELRKVVGKARRFADALAPLCTPGKGHLPGNSALGVHFVDRALFVAQDSRAAVKLYEEALKWDPSNPSAPELLSQTRNGIRSDRYGDEMDRALNALERQDYPGVLSATQKAYEQADSDEERSQALTLQALGLAGSKRKYAAIAVLQRALELDPTDETARSLLATLRNQL